MLNLEHGVLPAGSSDQAMRWPGVWARWDSGYYLTIARNGYSASNATPAFYPLYPLILRFIKIVTNLDVVSIGTIFSTIFTTIAFLVIFNTFSADFDISINKDIILLLSLFPTAFFLFSIYTESLFLFLSIIVYYLTQRKKWKLAALSCFLASITRDNGFLVTVIIAIEFLYSTKINKKSLISAFVLCLPGIIGFISYHAFLGIIFGDPLLSIHVHENVGKRFITWPWISILDTIELAVLGKGVEGNWFWRLVGWQELAFTGLFSLLAILGWKLLRPSLAAYLSLSLIVFTASHGPYGMGLMSVPRYVLPLFPGFIVMAIFLRHHRYLRWIVLTGSALLLLWYTFWFGSGRWVA